MTRIRFVSWLVLFGACCAIAPLFESTASGFGRHRQQVCVQYVYCPVYIEKDGGGDKEAAPRVRFFLILDTNDEEIGDDVRKAKEKIELVQRTIPDEYRGAYIQPVEGMALTADTVITELDRIKVNPNDTLVVYCNVHGVLGSSGQQLQMSGTVPGGTTRELLQRDRLAEALRMKPCRLKLLITDSCFSPPTGMPTAPDVETLFPKLQRVQLPPEKPKEAPGRPRNNQSDQVRVLRNLFLDHAGMLNMNSAAPNQYSFTQVFVEAFTEVALGFFQPDGPQQGVRVDWEYFLDEVRRRVDVRFDFGRRTLQTQAAETNPDERARRDAKQTLDYLKAQNQTRQDIYLFPVPGQASGYPTYAPMAEHMMQMRGGSTPTAAAGTGNDPYYGAGAGPAAMPALQAARPASPVSITVHIAPGTSLFLEDTPTKQSGAERYFQTRPLSQGEVVSYTFRAEGEVNGQKVVETQQAVCRPGQETVIRFEKFQPATVASR